MSQRDGATSAWGLKSEILELRQVGTTEDRLKGLSFVWRSAPRPRAQHRRNWNSCEIGRFICDRTLLCPGTGTLRPILLTRYDRGRASRDNGDPIGDIFG